MVLHNFHFHISFSPLQFVPASVSSGTFVGATEATSKHCLRFCTYKDMAFTYFCTYFTKYKMKISVPLLTLLTIAISIELTEPDIIWSVCSTIAQPQYLLRSLNDAAKLERNRTVRHWLEWTWTLRPAISATTCLWFTCDIRQSIKASWLIYSLCAKWIGYDPRTNCQLTWW